MISIKMIVAVMKASFKKMKPEIITCRNCKLFLMDYIEKT